MILTMGAMQKIRILIGNRLMMLNVKRDKECSKTNETCDNCAPPQREHFAPDRVRRSS